MSNSNIPLFNFAYHQKGTWEKVANVVEKEPWGKDYKVLELYLRANFEIAKTLGRVYENKDKGIAFWRAGCLVNATSDPAWMVYKPNNRDCNKWCFRTISSGDIPVKECDPKDYKIEYTPPFFNSDWDIHFQQLNLEHIFKNEENKRRLQGVFNKIFKTKINPLLIFKAIYGEIQLKKKKETVVPQWYRNDYQYLMPLFLLEDDKVDLTATLTPQPSMRRYIVRTLLLPQYAYAYARAVVKSRANFANWIIMSSNELDAKMTDNEEDIL